MFSAGMPNTAAISSATLCTHCVLSHSVRRSPSHAAMVACISIGIVVLARDHVGLVDLDLGGRERSFGIAAPRLRRPRLALIGLLLRRQNRLDAGDVGGPGFGRVGDAHQRRRVAGLFERFGDHERDRLALMAHPVVLEHVQALTDFGVDDGLVRAIGKPRRVAMRQDRDDAGRPFRRRAVDGSDAAVRDRAPHDDAVRLAGLRRTRRRRWRRR